MKDAHAARRRSYPNPVIAVIFRAFSTFYPAVGPAVLSVLRATAVVVLLCVERFFALVDHCRRYPSLSSVSFARVRNLMPIVIDVL